jgi:hypothetical protein
MAHPLFISPWPVFDLDDLFEGGHCAVWATVWVGFKKIEINQRLRALLAAPPAVMQLRDDRAPPLPILQSKKQAQGTSR